MGVFCLTQTWAQMEVENVRNVCKKKKVILLRVSERRTVLCKQYDAFRGHERVFVRMFSHILHRNYGITHLSMEICTL